MGDFIKTLTSLIGSIKAKTDGKIGILQKRIDDIPTETVLYTPQTLTEEQQKQARDNIGAIDAGSMFVVITKSTQNGETIYSADKTYDEIMEAVANKIVPVCNNPVDDSAYDPNNVRCIFRNGFYTAGVEYASFQSDGDEYFYEVLIFRSGKVTATAKPKIMTGATTDNEGTSGMVPRPYLGDNTKFLRGDGRWADVEGDTSLGISGAQVCQIAKITAVDAQGKPTAWEPVDMASGGEREWVEIGEVTTTEDTTEKMIMKFTQDVHGNPLSLKGVLIIGKPIFSDTNKHQCLLVCNDNKYGGNANYLLYEQILRNNQTFTVYSEFLRADGLNSVAVTAFNSGNVKQNGGCGTSVNTWSPGNDISLQFPMRGVTFTILDTGLLAGSNFKFWGVNA